MDLGLRVLGAKLAAVELCCRSCGPTRILHVGIKMNQKLLPLGSQFGTRFCRIYPINICKMIVILPRESRNARIRFAVVQQNQTKTASLADLQCKVLA